MPRGYTWACAPRIAADYHLWTAPFRIHARAASTLGLESAVRRLRASLVELGQADSADLDRVPLPPNLERLVEQIRQRIGGRAVKPAAEETGP